MVKGKQTRLVEMLYKGEIRDFVYEVYYGSDSHPHVRTFVILKDELNTKIGLEELGQYTEELIQELEKNGFSNINNNTLRLKKVA